MARVKAMTARISSGDRVRPHGGIIADFPTAAPPRAIMFSMYSSLKPFNLSPSFIKDGVGVTLLRLEGPAGVASAWHHTQFA